MAADAQPIKIAILAMGGEGGGVLADWLVDLGRHNGHIAQTTSVPGVAQRTGATIYYVELFPADAAKRAGAAPVLALMPLPGDVDVVLASELMEAARAVDRGLVTPDRTTLVASTHRVYAIAEKIAMADGRADPAALLAQARSAAKRFVGHDMAQAADAAGSVISAVLFGTLAGTGVLPFSRADFQATIQRGGVGVQASLKAFAAAFERTASGEPAVLAPGETSAANDAAKSATNDSAALPASPFVLPRAANPDAQALIERAAAQFSEPGLAVVVEGLRRLVDYQDAAYASLYLDRLQTVQTLDPEGTLTETVARHLALWMSYEDTIRVADLKTRSSRFQRVRDEVKAAPDQVLAINEYLHPRLQEVADTLPAGLGRWLLASGAPRRWLERVAAKGRVVQTSSLRGYLMLAGVAGLRRWRRGTLRFQAENARIESWLADIHQAAASHPALAVEMARCQNLVKGYGDTHERGLRSYGLLRAAWQRGGNAFAPALLAELRQAALADDAGLALDAALRRHALL